VNHLRGYPKAVSSLRSATALHNRGFTRNLTLWPERLLSMRSRDGFSFMGLRFCSRFMKNFLLAVLIMASLGTAHAQGTVWFLNVDHTQGLDAPFFQSDAVTKLSGPQFMAELLAGPSANSLASIATTGFLQGFVAGYFNGGVWAVPGVPQSQIAWVQVRAWNLVSGASFLQAQASGLPNSWGESPIFSVVTGSQAQPGILTGLGMTPILLNSIPEPPAFALAGLGAIIACRLRRRRIARYRVQPGAENPS